MTNSVQEHIVFQEHQGLHIYKKIKHKKPPVTRRTFSSSKKNSGSYLVNHARVVLNTITLISSKLTNKSHLSTKWPLNIWISPWNSEINAISAYSNIGIPLLEGLLIQSHYQRLLTTQHECTVSLTLIHIVHRLSHCISTDSCGTVSKVFQKSTKQL